MAARLAVAALEHRPVAAELAEWARRVEASARARVAMRGRRAGGECLEAGAAGVALAQLGAVARDSGVADRREAAGGLAGVGATQRGARAQLARGPAGAV